MIPRGVVLDASVLVAAALPAEEGYRAAVALLSELARGRIPAVTPAILITEFMSVLGRNRRPVARVRQLLAAYREGDTFSFVSVDPELAEHAGQIALTNHLKGCDAIYIALARQLMIPLVTLDREQRDRAPADVEVLLPAEALAAWFPS